MNCHSITSVLASLLLIVGPIQFGWAGSTVESPLSVDETLEGYELRIRELESAGGAYSGELAETLSDYGQALRDRGRYEEAADLFKRGAHLIRINQGLHNPAQIPMIQGEIESYFKGKNYAAIDQRQNYLFSLQKASLTDSDALARAYIQHANWQVTAFQQQLSSQPERLLTSSLFHYQQAQSLLSAKYGKYSPALLPALKGLQRARYLIADFEYTAPVETSSIEAFRNRQEFAQVPKMKSDNYQLGKNVIATMHSIQIEQLDEGKTDAETAKALVMLGDWHFYNGRRDTAFSVYKTVIRELEEMDDAKAQIAGLFGEPVPLPDIDGVRRIPPATDSREGAVVLEYSVSSRGRISHLRRLDTNGQLNSPAKRLMRKLRGTKFRPRFEAGQAAETTQIVQAFDMQ